MNTLSLHPTPPRTMLGEAFVVALVIEVLVLLAIAGWLGHHESKPEIKPPEPVRITMAPPAPASPAPKPAPVPAPAKPVVPRPQPPKPAPAKPQVQKVSPPAPLPKTAQPAEQAETPPVAHPDPVPDKAPAVAPPPPAQPPASASTAKPSAEFEAKLRDAVQAAVRYPSAAKIMRLTGHVRLGFLYQDGVVSNPRVLVSSGQAMLDRAALAALNDTNFPAAPAELKGHALNLEIVVTFSPSS